MPDPDHHKPSLTTPARRPAPEIPTAPGQPDQTRLRDLLLILQQPANTRLLELILNLQQPECSRLLDLLLTLQQLIEEDFTGWIRCNFSHGALGRIDKFEEILPRRTHMK
jgi:hypothetical protein